MMGPNRLGMTPPDRVGTEIHLDTEGYLHTGRSQRQPDRIVVDCGPTGADR